MQQVQKFTKSKKSG